MASAELPSINIVYPADNIIGVVELTINASDFGELSEAYLKQRAAFSRLGLCAVGFARVAETHGTWRISKLPPKKPIAI